MASDLPTVSLANIGDTFAVREILFPLTSAGEGYSEGVEFFVEKRLTSKLYGQGNLSFSRTRHAGLDGVLRPGSFDYPFVFNLLGGYRLSPAWELSARLSFLSGRPFTPYDQALSTEQRRGVYDLTRVNAERAPDYGRVDIRVDRTFTVGGQPLNLFFGVQNVTNRRNFASYTWNRRTEHPAVRRAAGHLPDPRLRLAILNTMRRITADACVIGVLVMTMATLQAGPAQQSLRVGDRLPILTGQFLSGRDAELPAATSGKIALVAMGFTYNSRFPVEAWGSWWRGTMGWRTDVTFFEVPMIGGLSTLGRWFIDRGMRSGTPAELHEQVMTVYGGTGEWKRRLSYSSDHEARCLPDSSLTGRGSCAGCIAASSTSLAPMSCTNWSGRSPTGRHAEEDDRTRASATGAVTPHEPGSTRTATRARDRRNRLHRRTAGACPRSRGSWTSLSGAATGGARITRVARPPKSSRATSSIRRPSIAPSPASTWPITWCTPWGRTATIRNGSHRRP